MVDSNFVLVAPLKAIPVGEEPTPTVPALTPVLTSEISGLALNWAVAQIDGKAKFGIRGVFDGDLFLWADEEHLDDFLAKYNTWLKGGPLYEQMLLDGMLLEAVDVQYRGRMPPFKATTDKWHSVYRGSTPVEAALRALVAREFGEFVLIPAELVNVIK